MIDAAALGSLSDPDVAARLAAGLCPNGASCETDDCRLWHDARVTSGKLARVPGGRPAIGKAFLQRFTPEQEAAIDALAAAEGVKRAEMIRRLVNEALAARGR